MAFKTKYVILLIVIASFSAIGYGFSVLDEDPPLGNKCIGFGTVGLFLIAMPLFLFKESKGKKVKDYMLTEENILKKRADVDKKSKKKEPQN